MSTATATLLRDLTAEANKLHMSLSNAAYRAAYGSWNNVALGDTRDRRLIRLTAIIARSERRVARRTAALKAARQSF